MVRRPKPILEVLYEPRDGTRGAGGIAHELGHVEQYGQLGVSNRGHTIGSSNVLQTNESARPRSTRPGSNPWTHLGYLPPVTD
jgi:hypothetical protein